MNYLRILFFKLFIISVFLCPFLEGLGREHFLIMGAPGSGKGTFSQFLMMLRDYKHLCLGDLIKKEIANDTETGRICKPYVEAGKLVPNDLLYELFEKHFIEALESKDLIIVDGMVQSLEHVQFFDALIQKYQVSDQWNFVYIRVDQGTSLLRMLERRVCSQCGIIYQSSSEFCEARCAICNGVIVKRLDDQDVVIRRRIERFFNQTYLLVEHYRNRQEFFEFDGNKNRNELLIEYRETFGH